MISDDSVYCTYCGYNNTNSDNVNSNKGSFKRCIDCGKEVPFDSEFCQYCGSKRLALVNEQGSASKKKCGKVNIFMIMVVVALLISNIYFGYKYSEECKKSYYWYESSVKAQESLSSEKTKSKNYKSKAEYYDDIIYYSSSSRSYNDLFVTETIVRNPQNRRISVYYSGGSTIYCKASSPLVTASWSKKWNGYWTTLEVTYTGSGVEYVKVFTENEKESITIIVLG